MAQVVVDSSVMRDKAKTLENAAVTIQSLYAEMLQEVTTTANKMKGTTIETEKKQLSCTFSGVQTRLDAGIVDTQEFVCGSGSTNVVRFSLITLFTTKRMSSTSNSF